MLRRTIWFTIGLATGVFGSAYAYARVRELRDKVTADGMADTVAGVARRLGTTVVDAVAEGRSAMRDAEQRIAADLDART